MICVAKTTGWDWLGPWLALCIVRSHAATIRKTNLWPQNRFECVAAAKKTNFVFFPIVISSATSPFPATGMHGSNRGKPTINEFCVYTLHVGRLIYVNLSLPFLFSSFQLILIEPLFGFWFEIVFFFFFSSKSENSSATHREQKRFELCYFVIQNMWIKLMVILLCHGYGQLGHSKLNAAFNNIKLLREMSGNSSASNGPDYVCIHENMWTIRSSSARHKSQTPQWLAEPWMRLQTWKHNGQQRANELLSISRNWLVLIHTQRRMWTGHHRRRRRHRRRRHLVVWRRWRWNKLRGRYQSGHTFRTHIGVFRQFWFDFNGRAVMSRTQCPESRPGQLNKCPKMCKLKTFFLFFSFTQSANSFGNLSAQLMSTTWPVRHSSRLEHAPHALSNALLAWSLIADRNASHDTCNSMALSHTVSILRLANWFCGSLALSGISFRLQLAKSYERDLRCVIYAVNSCLRNFDVLWHFRRHQNDFTWCWAAYAKRYTRNCMADNLSAESTEPSTVGHANRMNLLIRLPFHSR